ncbi:MAG: hypothetical protein R3288_04670 [Woeseiaceae bacterium]|nr:hypothetical protein [Woeseiaceae bacterium]
MHKLLQLLLDIILLRRGPDDLPHSWLVLVLCVALWLLALLATTLSIANFDRLDASIAVGSAAVGALSYLVILQFAGFAARALQTLSALIGTGALISFAMLAVLVLMTPFLGPRIANAAAFLLLVWSVPVKGHIIARAINWHWYAGTAVALAVFLLQLAFTQAMTPRA